MTNTIFRLSATAAGSLCGAAVFLVIALCVLVMALIYQNSQRDILSEELRGLAGAAAASIDGDLHNRIRDPAQMNGSEYTRAITPLISIHNAFSRITYLYTMIEKEGVAWFVLDTAADPRLKTDRALEASSIMEKYEMDRAAQASWLKALRAGEVFVDEDFVTDEYGTFISGSAPFYDSAGNYAGFVGVDYDVALYLARDYQTRLALIVALVVGAVFSLLIGLFIWRLKRSQDSSQVQRQIAESGLAHTSTLLQTTLNTMDQGFLVWDQENRVIVCNDRYHELWGYPAELLTPGTHLIDLLRYRAGKGAYGEGDTEVLAEAKMEQILSRWKEPGGRFIAVDERTLMIRHFSLREFEYVTICTDFTDLTNLQNALQESQARLLAIFDNTPVCLNLKDTEGRYVVVNKPYEEWLGLSADRIVGKRSRDIMSNADEIERVESAERAMLESGLPEESEIKVERADGQIHDRYLIKFPVKADDGTITGLGSVSIDISALKQTERELRGAKDQAERANLAKSGFLATMSHELRTPLNAILGFSAMIKEQVLGPVNMPAYLDYAGDINSSGRHLLNLIDDLLDLSKIESGKYEFLPENLNLEALVSEAIHSVEPMAADHKVEIHSELNAGSLPFEADRRAVIQILLNLLSNAIKFSPQDSHIAVSAWRDGDWIKLVIADNGIGIRPDDIARVVIPWEQIKDPTIAEGGGSGLGLPIVNSLVELHGGRLHIDSEVGKGTTITVTLPEKGAG